MTHRPKKNMSNNYNEYDNDNENYYNYMRTGTKLETKARKKLRSWGLFCNKHKDAAELYDKAAHHYNLVKLWDRAGNAYVKSASCYLQLDNKHEAANAYAEAGRAYKNTSTVEATSCLGHAANIFLKAGKPTLAAACCKEISEMHEEEQDFKPAIYWGEKAVNFYRRGEDSTSVNLCRQKIAEMAALLQQYPKAIDIYEDMARQFLGTPLMPEVKGLWLKSGICHLNVGDSVAVTNALDEYQAMDPTFTDTPECKFFSDLASAVNEKDFSKYTAIIREFERTTYHLDSWKTLLLLKVKAKMINPEFDNGPL